MCNDKVTIWYLIITSIAHPIYFVCYNIWLNWLADWSCFLTPSDVIEVMFLSFQISVVTISISENIPIVTSQNYN